MNIGAVSPAKINYAGATGKKIAANNGNITRKEEINANLGYAKVYYGINNSTTAHIEIKSDGSQKNIKFNTYCLGGVWTHSFDYSYDYEIKQVGGKFEFVNAKYYYSSPGIEGIITAAAKKEILSNLEKLLNKETKPEYKKILQCVYDGTKLIKAEEPKKSVVNPPKQ